MESTCIRALADTKQIERCKTLINEMSPELSLLAAIVNLTGNETRLKILYLLQLEKRLCVCDMSDILEMTVPAISQQLRKLTLVSVKTHYLLEPIDAPFVPESKVSPKRAQICILITFLGFILSVVGSVIWHFGIAPFVNRIKTSS